MTKQLRHLSLILLHEDKVSNNTLYYISWYMAQMFFLTFVCLLCIYIFYDYGYTSYYTNTANVE